MKPKFRFYFFKLSLIIIVVFILQSIIPGFTEMFILNSKVRVEYWRYLTAIFLHGNLVHLIYNLFALLFFGFALERLIGSRRFLIVFFASGIIANIIAVNFYESSLGASGAIYGILGALTIIKPLMMIWAFGLIMPLFVAAIVWIIADVLRSLGAFGATNIGSIAHLSGIMIGFIMGILFKIVKKRRVEKSAKIEIPTFYLKNWEDRYLR